MEDPAAPPAVAEDFVQVRVGGVVFETKVETLVRIPYFSSAIERFGETGPFVVDRDPKAFRHILNHVRDHGYGIPTKYAPDVDFYGLDSGEREVTSIAHPVPAWMSGERAVASGEGVTKVRHNRTIPTFRDVSDEVMIVMYTPGDGDEVDIVNYKCTDGTYKETFLPRDLALVRAVIPGPIKKMYDGWETVTGRRVAFLPANLTVYPDVPVNFSCSVRFTRPVFNPEIICIYSLLHIKHAIIVKEVMPAWFDLESHRIVWGAYDPVEQRWIHHDKYVLQDDAFTMLQNQPDSEIPLYRHKWICQRLFPDAIIIGVTVFGGVRGSNRRG